LRRGRFRGTATRARAGSRGRRRSWRSGRRRARSAGDRCRRHIRRSAPLNGWPVSAASFSPSASTSRRRSVSISCA
jgi:hypothetical protein